MSVIKVRENEPFDVTLRRFERSCKKTGILTGVRSRKFYEKPIAERKRRAVVIVRRHARRVQRE